MMADTTESGTAMAAVEAVRRETKKSGCVDCIWGTVVYVPRRDGSTAELLLVEEGRESELMRVALCWVVPIEDFMDGWDAAVKLNIIAISLAVPKGSSTRFYLTKWNKTYYQAQKWGRQKNVAKIILYLQIVLACDDNLWSSAEM